MKKSLSILLVTLLCVGLFSGAASAETASATVSSVTTNGNGGKTDVGIWYVTYNSETAWTDNLGAGKPVGYRSLMPDGSYGIPDSSDTAVIDFHLSELADAKIDFVVFDLTNVILADGLINAEDAWIVDNTVLTCQRIANWNRNNSWKIRYAFAIGVYTDENGQTSIGGSTETQAKTVYENFYNNTSYGRDNYYQINKTPLLIVYDASQDVLNGNGGWNSYTGDRTYGDKFVVRGAKSGETGTYGFDNRNGPNVNSEVSLISPGYNSHSTAQPEVERKKGDTYKENWEKVLNSETPAILVISSFNDYCQDTAVFTADTSNCESGFEEQWLDKNGQISNTMYWNMTREGIIKLRLKNGDKFKDLPSLTLDEHLTVGDITLFDENDETNTEKSDDDTANIDTKDKNNSENQDDEVKNTKKIKKFLAIILILFMVGVIITYIYKSKLKKPTSLDEDDIQNTGES